jgi:hypothetical protein
MRSTAGTARRSTAPWSRADRAEVAPRARRLGPRDEVGARLEQAHAYDSEETTAAARDTFLTEVLRETCCPT